MRNLLLKKNDNSGNYVSCIPSSDLKLETIGQKLKEKGGNNEV